MSWLPSLADRGAAALVVAMALVGCASTSPGMPVEAPPTASAEAGSDAGACAPIELRTPSGARVDLTGTWEGGIFIHHVRQVGDCVWWIGYARWPGTDPGDLATLTFFGHLATDFTLSGSWATIVRPSGAAAYYPGPLEGDLVFNIGFDPATGVATTLTRVGAGTTDAEYSSDVLRLVGPLPESANPLQY